MPLEDDEDIARAICSEKGDEPRVSPSLMRGPNTSVSRLTIAPLEQTWEVFRRNVEKPPSRKLELIATINVGTLRGLGESYRPQPTKITVEAAPLEGYPSHAIIPNKLSRGLATKIVNALDRHYEKPENSRF